MVFTEAKNVQEPPKALLVGESTYVSFPAVSVTGRNHNARVYRQGA